MNVRTCVHASVYRLTVNVPSHTSRLACDVTDPLADTDTHIGGFASNAVLSYSAVKVPFKQLK